MEIKRRARKERCWIYICQGSRKTTDPRNSAVSPKPNNAALDQTNRIRLQNGKENGRKSITFWGDCWPSTSNDMLIICFQTLSGCGIVGAGLIQKKSRQRTGSLTGAGNAECAWGWSGEQELVYSSSSPKYKKIMMCF